MEVTEMFVRSSVTSVRAPQSVVPWMDSDLTFGGPGSAGRC